MKSTLYIISLLLSTSIVFSQIKLPKDFKCNLGINHGNESYFSNGDLRFHYYPWGHDGLVGRDLLVYLEKNGNVKFKRTKDGLYWRTGGQQGSFFYTIIYNEGLELTLISKNNTTEFSYYSTWLLQQIRMNLKNGNDIYLTNHNGEECNGTRN